MMGQRGCLPRVMIAAPGSGSGKTMITCGLLTLLQSRCRPAAFKCGPDYIDPLFHQSVLGVPSRNLDTYFTEPPVTRYLMARGAANADVAVIEGVMGYYDGLGGVSVRGSSYELSVQTGTPVILVVNGRGMSLSMVAMIRGFLELYPDQMIRGVILNRVSAAVCERLTPLIEAQLGIRVVGYVPETEMIRFPSRHLGLMLPDEIAHLREQMRAFAGVLSETLDMETWWAIARSAAADGDMALERCGADRAYDGYHSPQLPVRIGIARDEAFCFYYEDNLELLRELGAELVPFSPLHDRQLPGALDGLYMGGGYPELHGRILSENRTMRQSIRAAVEEGMPCLAECGAFMYLHEAMTDADGHSWPMVGVIPGRVSKRERLVRFGYTQLTAMADTILGPAGTQLPAHEFHYWDTSVEGGCFEAVKPLTDRSWRCMYQRKQLLAGFPHLYFYGNRAAAGNYVAACRQYGMDRRKKEQLKMLNEKIWRAELLQQLCMIDQPDEKAMAAAWAHWDQIGKPLRSLGLLEKAVVRMAGMKGTADVKLDKKAIVVLCGDHGVVAEGVTQTDSQVTRIVAENFTRGLTCVNVMAQKAGAEVFPVDMGMLGEPYPCRELRPMTLCDKKLGQGTGNIAVEPAMSDAACMQAILTGIQMVGELAARGYDVIGMGEMGIGNTTASSALVAALLDLPAEEVTGRGAGLSDEGLRKKQAVIEQAVRRYWQATEHSKIKEGPYFHVEAAVEVMAQLGGYEIAGMTGLCLGGAIYGVPIILDGYISAAAALCASLISKESTGWMLASHVSAEPAARRVLRSLKLEPVIDAGMCTGEGTGAAAAMSLYDMGLAVYQNMGTFEEIQVTPYHLHI